MVICTNTRVERGYISYSSTKKDYSVVGSRCSGMFIIPTFLGIRGTDPPELIPSTTTKDSSLH